MWKTKSMLVLASQSPTRKALLRQAGIAFAAKTAGVNERAIEARVLGDGGGASNVAAALAQAKALAADGAVVVGADQVLALDGSLLHKPADRLEAVERLLALSGRTHELHTAVALARAGQVVWSTVVLSRMTMRRFDPVEAEAVLDADGGAALGSTGAYRLEGPAIRLFERIEGDYFAILGLPLLDLLAALRQHAP